jgi:hypothetical protein
MKKSKFNMKKCFVLLLLLVGIFIAGSYIKVEILTSFYGKQFSDLYDESGYIESIK